MADITYAETFYNWGNLLAQTGDCNNALKMYDQASELRPFDIQTYHNRARVLANMGEYVAARESLTLALQYQTEELAGFEAQEVDLAYAHNNLATILELSFQFDNKIDRDRGDDVRKQVLEEEEKLYQVAVRSMPDYTEAHFNLARVLAELNKPKLALQHLRNYVRLAEANAHRTPSGEYNRRYCRCEKELSKTFYPYVHTERYVDQIVDRISPKGDAEDTDQLDIDQFKTWVTLDFHNVWKDADLVNYAGTEGPWILRLVTKLRMACSEVLVCSGILGR